MKFTKTIEVKNIFNKISYKYDFLNNLLSFGLHKLWKRKLVNLLDPSNGEDWADLCCGTGDLAFLISKRVSSKGSITGIDSAQEILLNIFLTSIVFVNFIFKFLTYFFWY